MYMCCRAFHEIHFCHTSMDDLIRYHTTIHRKHITPDRILIICTNGKSNFASMSNMCLITFHQPFNKIRSIVFVNFQVEAINKGLRDEIFATSTINNNCEILPMNGTRGTENNFPQPFLLNSGYRLLLHQEKCTICFSCYFLHFIGFVTFRIICCFRFFLCTFYES